MTCCGSHRKSQEHCSSVSDQRWQLSQCPISRDTDAGAVLVTPDGQWPADDQQPQLEVALQKCGIKIWELYRVDNSSDDAAPLTVPEGPMKTVELVM